MRGGFTCKGLDFASMKLKVATRFGDPQLLADAMKSYQGVEDLNTRLEEFELFRSTKRKLDLLPYVECDLHQPNKVNY